MFYSGKRENRAEAAPANILFSLLDRSILSKSQIGRENSKSKKAQQIRPVLEIMLL